MCFMVRAPGSTVDGHQLVVSCDLQQRDDENKTGDAPGGVHSVGVAEVGNVHGLQGDI